MQTALHRQNKRVLYRLKRERGTAISILEKTNVATDTQTGRKTYGLSKIDIRRAIVLPAREFRMFVYDLAYIAANKDFTTGAFFDPTDRKFIIDSADLPAGFVLTVDHYIVASGLTYNIVEINDFVDHSGYVVTGRVVRGAKKVLLETPMNVLILSQSCEGEL